jgi:hypothetical protein
LETKPLDVMAILKLYELRGEALMREARAWFFTEFAPRSGKDIVRLMMSGQKESAFYRMVASHWEVAASFVNHGGIDERLFLESNSEHVVVYAKLRPFLAEAREVMGEPDYMANLERLVLKVPDVEKKLENRRLLLERWARSHASGLKTREGDF